MIMARYEHDARDEVQRLQAHLGEAKRSYFVCDVCDAFFAVPLNPDGRRYFAGRYRGHVYIYI